MHHTHNYRTKHRQVAPRQLLVRRTQVLLEFLERKLNGRHIKEVLQALHELAVLEEEGRHVRLRNDRLVLVGEEVTAHELVQHQVVHLEVREVFLLAVHKPQYDGEEVLQLHHRLDVLLHEYLVHQQLHQFLTLGHLERVRIPEVLDQVVEWHPILLRTGHVIWWKYFSELSRMIFTIR